MTGIYEASKARFIRRISADFCRVECNWDNRKWDDLFHYLLFELHLTRQKCDVATGPKKRDFTDCSIEIFYVDYLEPGQPKKAPLFLELTINYPCFLKANQNPSFREWYSVSFSWERFCQHFNGKRWKVLWGELSIMSTQSSAVIQFAEYDRTRRDLARAEPFSPRAPRAMRPKTPACKWCCDCSTVRRWLAKRWA